MSEALATEKPVLSPDGAPLGTLIGRDGIRFERLLHGPIDRVWAYLTQSSLRGRWLASGEVEQRVGAEVRLEFDHTCLPAEPEVVPDQYRSLEKGGGFSVRVTRCEPPFVLAHTWPDESGTESEVTFELAPEGERVRLVLTHRRMGEAWMRKASGGWHVHLDILSERLAGTPPGPFWERFEKLEATYGRLLDAR